MKKITLTILLLLMVILSACAGNTSPTKAPDPVKPETVASAEVNEEKKDVPPADAVVQDTSSTTSGLDTTYENAASVEMQVLVGIFKLSGTDKAVTKDQATALLTIWKEFQTMTESMAPQGTPGQSGQGQEAPTGQPQGMSDEVKAKIETWEKGLMAAMTVDQIKAIAEMKITQESAMTFLKEQGILTENKDGQAGGGQSGGGNPPPQGGQGGAEGTPPAGGEMMGTPPAGGGQSRGGMMIQPDLINALIKYLEQTSGVQSVEPTKAS